MAPRVTVTFADLGELQAQREHLERDGLLVRVDCAVALGGECVVELVHPDGDRLELPALVAWVGEGGTGFALRAATAEVRAELARWLAPPTTAGPVRERLALNPHERLRGITPVEQLKVARNGEVAERIVLERLYGKAVWEALLRNPRLTPPEVAHIARMGQLPRPLVETIVSNPGWLQSPQVRRALLGNPRLGLEQIERVLRATPRNEVKIIAAQTAYPLPVRAAAKKLLAPG